jgi:peptide/nickel transport system ATP-binding protein/oligopeptide transport system ATP-binding protein
MPAPIVECVGVSKSFAVRRGGHRYVVRAVDDVSLSLAPGETLGLVGESGSGKSTLGRLVTSLFEPTAGEVLVAGTPTGHLRGRKQRELRRRLQIVWQNPFSSMNVRDTIETILTEAPQVHGLIERRERRARAEELLATVGLPDEVLRKRPDQLSGGQLQRIAIGRALALDPDVVVCDEVTSALDASVQAQILNLLHEVQQRTNVAYLFISHNLDVVRHISDRVAVMYGGRVVEYGDADAVYADPAHPYTRELVRVTHAERIAEGRTADASVDAAPAVSGCRYAPYCTLRVERCIVERPELQPVPSGALAACHVTAPVRAS